MGNNIPVFTIQIDTTLNIGSTYIIRINSSGFALIVDLWKYSTYRSEIDPIKNQIGVNEAYKLSYIVSEGQYQDVQPLGTSETSGVASTFYKVMEGNYLIRPK